MKKGYSPGSKNKLVPFKNADPVMKDEKYINYEYCDRAYF